jgi:hypothetical protein
MTVALGFVMMAVLVTGHVRTRPPKLEGDRVPAAVAALPLSVPVSAPAGVELLMIVR